MTSISLTSGELLDIIKALEVQENRSIVKNENPQLAAYYLRIIHQFDEISNRLEDLPGEKRVANLILAM